MSSEIEVILDDCLAWLAAGASLDSCLARYPDHVEELRPLLEMTLAVRSTPTPQARSATVRVGRQRMLMAAAAKQRSQAVSKSFFSRYAERIIIRITGKENLDMKLIARLTLATFVVVLLIVGGGVTAASATALPGDALYPVKLTIDDLRLSLASDPATRTQLEQQVQAAREQEVQAALQQRRLTEVHFVGQLLAVAPNSWLVGKLRVNLDAGTQVSGQPTIGAMVEVWASTQADGTLLARRLAVRGVTSAVTPMPNTSPLPTPIMMTTRMATQMPMPTQWSTAMPTHMATQMPMPTQWSTPMPMPTHMATQMPMPTQWSNPMPMPTHQSTQMPMPTQWSTPMPMPTRQSTQMPMPTHRSTQMPMPTHQSGPMPTSWPHR